MPTVLSQHFDSQTARDGRFLDDGIVEILYKFRGRQREEPFFVADFAIAVGHLLLPGVIIGVVQRERISRAVIGDDCEGMRELARRNRQTGVERRRYLNPDLIEQPVVGGVSSLDREWDTLGLVARQKADDLGRVAAVERRRVERFVGDNLGIDLPDLPMSLSSTLNQSPSAEPV
jgi:hypothetical protein